MGFKSETARRSALRLLGFMCLAVFAGEAGIMALLPFLDISDPVIEAVTDSALLTVVLFPVLYFFVVRRLSLESKAKSDFLSSMSHELRTPMNAVLGFAQLLDQNSTEPLTKTQKEYVDEIMQSGQHMVALIDDVLEMARVAHKGASVKLEAVAPGPIIDTCVAAASAMAKQADVKVLCRVPDDLPPVLADARHLKQVLLNLLSNGVKYNSAGGQVVLECVTDADAYGRAGAGSYLRFMVTDTGCGIPLEMQHKVFEPFERLGAENSTVPGTGVGLAVTKRMVEEMGGVIGFDSITGEGTRFWIHLPIIETVSDPRSEAKNGTVAQARTSQPIAARRKLRRRDKVRGRRLRAKPKAVQAPSPSAQEQQSLDA